jgi:hypothetical protein
MKVCGKCKVEKLFTEFSKRSLSKDGLQAYCKECKLELAKKYYDKDKQIESVYKWRNENRDRFNSYRREYKKSKREQDPFFKLRQTLSNRTTTAFKLKGWSKNSKTQEMLGAEYKTVMSHIEYRFKSGMSWDNQGEWHIDHIIPLASAKTEQELIQLCHYTNLQPLWAEENISKGDKIIACRINL